MGTKLTRREWNNMTTSAPDTVAVVSDMILAATDEESLAAILSTATRLYGAGVVAAALEKSGK